MKQLDFDNLLQDMICLECGKKMDFYPIDNGNGILICTKCHSVYNFSNDILTILPKEYLEQEKYLAFLFKNEKFFKKNKALKDHYLKFIDKLKPKKSTWEDDDVQFWDERYLKDYLELKTKKLVARSYLQDKILFKPLRDRGIKDHKILEVGCGEAIAVQKMLLPYGNNFTYIATDYSYQALEFLKKRLKSKKNIFYLQCLGDAIPFKDNVFDDIICLGVIHHMPKKEKHVLDLLKKLKPEGLLLINEPYERDYRLPKFVENIIQKIIEPQQSAHEERINIKRFKSNFSKKGQILNEYHGHTPTKTLIIRMTGTLYEKSITFTKFVLLADKITEKTLGKIWGLFSTGDCLLLFQKKK